MVPKPTGGLDEIATRSTPALWSPPTVPQEWCRVQKLCQKRGTAALFLDFTLSSASDALKDRQSGHSDAVPAYTPTYWPKDGSGEGILNLAPNFAATGSSDPAVSHCCKLLSALRADFGQFNQPSSTGSRRIRQ